MPGVLPSGKAAGKPAASWATRAWGLLGYRGLCLLWLGLVDLTIAVGLIGTGEQALIHDDAEFKVIGYYPLDAWAVVWAATGLLCLVQAWMRSDRLAFAVATAVKVVWGTLALSAVFLHDHHEWLSGIGWIAFAGAVAIFSGMQEAR